jgi:PilZ domain
MGFVRRSGRIGKEIRILLIGTDTSGRVFAEETQTVTLSRHGAGIISKHKLAPDGILIFRFLGGSSEASIRLVGQLGEDIRGYIYGVAFVDPNLDFWELKFPPPPKWCVDFEDPLQCTTCQSLEVVDQSEIEADVYALAAFILRFCANCGMSTQWRLATKGIAIGAVKPVPASPGAPLSTKVISAQQELHRAMPIQPESAPRPRLAGIEVTVSDAMPPEPLPPAATASVAHSANRRRDVRTRVSFTACIRQDGAEEIVACGNVSKSGFSFRSRKTYLAGSAIDAALPYYPGMQPAFVAAVIRHALVLPNSNYHYGVMYAAPHRFSKS